MPVIDELLKSHKRLAETFDQGDLPMPPARKVAVIACMDARLHPEKILGLEIGDAHVIRNAGGRASDDAIRSLIISSNLLGTRDFASGRQRRRGSRQLRSVRAKSTSSSTGTRLAPPVSPMPKLNIR